MSKKDRIVVLSRVDEDGDESTVDPLVVFEENTLLWAIQGQMERIIHKQRKSTRKKERAVFALQKRAALLEKIADRQAKEITKLQKEAKEKDRIIAELRTRLGEETSGKET